MAHHRSRWPLLLAAGALLWAGFALLDYVDQTALVGLRATKGASLWLLVAGADGLLAVGVVLTFLLVPMKRHAVLLGGVLIGSAHTVVHYLSTLWNVYVGEPSELRDPKLKYVVALLLIILQAMFVALLVVVQPVHLASMVGVDRRHHLLLGGPMPLTVGRALSCGKRFVYKHLHAGIAVCDVGGFSSLCKELNLAGREVCALLDELHQALDRAVATRGMQRLRVDGDRYIAVGGVSFLPPDAEAPKQSAQTLQTVVLDGGAAEEARMSLPPEADGTGCEEDRLDERRFACMAASSPRVAGAFLSSRITIPDAISPLGASSQSVSVSDVSLMRMRRRGHRRSSTFRSSISDSMSRAVLSCGGDLAVDADAAPTSPTRPRSRELELAATQSVVAACLMHLAAEAVGVPVRVGVNVGPLCSSVVGHGRFSWDMWGKPLSTAVKLRDAAPLGGVAVPRAVWDLLGSPVAELFGEEVDVPLRGCGVVQVRVMSRAQLPHFLDAVLPACCEAGEAVPFVPREPRMVAFMDAVVEKAAAAALEQERARIARLGRQTVHINAAETVDSVGDGDEGDADAHSPQALSPRSPRLPPLLSQAGAGRRLSGCAPASHPAVGSGPAAIPSLCAATMTKAVNHPAPNVV